MVIFSYIETHNFLLNIGTTKVTENIIEEFRNSIRTIMNIWEESQVIHFG